MTKRVLIELDDDEHQALNSRKGVMTWKEFLMCQKDVFDAKKAVDGMEKMSQLERIMIKLNDSSSKTETIRRLGFVTGSEVRKIIEDVVRDINNEVGQLSKKVTIIDDEVDKNGNGIDARVNNLIRVYNKNYDDHEARLTVLEDPFSCGDAKSRVGHIGQNQDCKNKNVHHVGGHHQVT